MTAVTAIVIIIGIIIFVVTVTFVTTHVPLFYDTHPFPDNYVVNHQTQIVAKQNNVQHKIWQNQEAISLQGWKQDRKLLICTYEKQ